MISIIIPVFNAEKYIERTIASVEAQSYTDWELLLVDDGSTDGSVSVIEAYLAEHPETAAKTRLLTGEKSGSAAMARNRGLDAARGRYIAFLDADDLWRPEKLSNEMEFMRKQDAGFVYTTYEFGDADAVPTGKMVRALPTLRYEEALSRTIIFTSTVLIDLQKVDKQLVYMPAMASEDTATWWRILQSGVTAYGLDQPLVIYRRPVSSLSSNKVVAVKRAWNLFRKIAGLNPFLAFFYLIRWGWRATVRRAIDDSIRRNIEALKRFTVVQLSLVGLLVFTAIYGGAWFRWIYPMIRQVRVTSAGVVLGKGLKLYFRGHILILVIYFVLLFYLSSGTGATKTGYHKPGSIFAGQVIALLLTNVLTYFQLILIRNWLLPVWPLAAVFGAQLAVAAVWAWLSDLIYRRVFPPRETLVLDLDPEADDGRVRRTLECFNTRADRFQITKVLAVGGLSAGSSGSAPAGASSGAERGPVGDAGPAADFVTLDQARQECTRWYDCVIICGGTADERRDLTEFCYDRRIRTYLVASVHEVLLQGAERMDLFDIPVLELKEYSIRWESALAKRLMDIAVGAVGSVVCIPWMLLKGKGRDNAGGGARWLGKNRRPFERKAPAILNVLRGDMSLVGPAPVDEETARARMQEDPRYGYRFRVKPGLISWRSLYEAREMSANNELKMDLIYIQNYSLLNDFRLVLQALVRKIIRF